MISRKKKEMLFTIHFSNQLFVYLSVMLLNELKPGLKYETGECGGDSPATKRFVISGLFLCLHFLKFSLQRTFHFYLVVVDGSQSFEGTGASKKLAKQACARYVLISLKKYIA